MTNEDPRDTIETDPQRLARILMSPYPLTAMPVDMASDRTEKYRQALVRALMEPVMRSATPGEMAGDPTESYRLTSAQAVQPVAWGVVPMASDPTESDQERLAESPPPAWSAVLAGPIQQHRVQLAAAQTPEPSPSVPDNLIAPAPAPNSFAGAGPNQPEFAAPSVTSGSFSPVPDYARLSFPGVKSRVHQKLPGPFAERPATLRDAVGVAPNLTPSPVTVPPVLPRLSRRTSEQNAPSGEWESGMNAPPYYAAVIAKAEAENGLPQNFYANVLRRESRFHRDALGPRTKSGDRAQGIAQFMPQTAAGENIDPYDPQQAIPAGAAYLRRLIDQFGGRIWLGLAAYNWGPERVREWLAAGANPSKLPKHTREYISDILVPPRAEIERLRSNPQMRSQFDAMYGPGAAARVLSR